MNHVRAGSREFLLTSLDGVHVISGKIQGVLGQEFLSHMDYLLDMENRRLILGAAALEGGTRAGFCFDR